MKYQVGEKVKYDSNEWSFFGTITAVIENSISPCYRINVERMEKMNCKFTITQFEFELEKDSDISIEKTNLEKNEDEYLTKNISIELDENVSKELEPGAIPVLEPIPVQESLQENDSTKKQVIHPGLLDAQKEINQGITKRKRYGSWENNFELYCSGHKEKTINTWMYQNRQQYKSGTLKKEHLEKLMQINFPFEFVRKTVPQKGKAKKSGIEKVTSLKKIEEPTDIWHKQLRQWKLNDNRTSLQQWRQQNVKRYVEGKLSKDKIEKLKEVGILK